MAATEVKHRNPLPRGPFGAIVIMYFTNSLSQTILFPFAAVMVQSFGVTDDPAKLGYYAGYLASSAFCGSLLSSSVWGALSDRVGRKPILLIGLTGNMICAILFGLSTSFQWAMTVRFINGLFSTIVATGRSTVAELCDNTNQAQGFALIGTMFGAGLLLGPALGGFLCQPADKYPFLAPPGSIFEKYPFLLPCVVLCGLTALGLISTICFLPETRGRAKAKENVGGEGKEAGTQEESDTQGESGWHGVGAHSRSSLDGDSLSRSGRRVSESSNALNLPLLKTGDRKSVV